MIFDYLRRGWIWGPITAITGYAVGFYVSALIWGEPSDAIGAFSAVATWIGSLGTAGALLFVALQFQLLSNQDKEEGERKRRSHAEQLSAWVLHGPTYTIIGDAQLPSEEEVEFHWVVSAFNASDSVYTNISIAAVFQNGFQQDSWDVLRPKEERSWSIARRIPIGSSLNTFSSDPSRNDPLFLVMFDDSHGFRWARKITGELASIPNGIKDSVANALAALQFDRTQIPI